MDGWTDEWMDEMDGWTDGWMDEMDEMDGGLVMFASNVVHVVDI